MDNVQVESLNTITLQAQSNGYVQFGRLITVEVRNFKTKQKITFSHPLRIDFDFFKSIDEVDQASVGQIRIYNLSESTSRFITEAGSEVKLSFGYNSTDNVKTLFYASITSVHREKSGEDTVSIMNVSANFMDYTFSKSVRAYNESTIIKEAFEIAEADLGVSYSTLSLHNFPQDSQNQVAELLQTKKIVSMQDPMNGKNAIQNFAYKYSFSYRVDTDDDGARYAIFFIRDDAVQIYLQFSQMGYQKIEEVSEESYTRTIKSEEEKQKSFDDIFVSTDNSTSFVFSRETGLLGSPQEEVQIVSVPESWNIGSNEQITRRGAETIAKNQQKDSERYSKWQKKKAEGKTTKEFKPRNEGKKQISRTFIRVKTLINPSVKPQNHVTIDSQISEYDGVYRVRNITYKGTNGEGECYMEMYCEDNSGLKDKNLTEEQKQSLSNNQELSVSGGLGNDLQEGVTIGGDD